MKLVKSGRRRGLIASLSVLGWIGAATTAWAAVAWQGGFETGDTSEYDFLLNGQVNGQDYITVMSDEVAQGRFAARVELHDDAVWPNGLKRVELQHRPEDQRTAEGATTYFAWSFFLPETLPTDPGQTIGYWESTNSYQQMMAFQVDGERIRFYTRRPENQLQWEDETAATAGQWHRIAMRVHFSTDPEVGEVDLWFDGEQVLTAGAAQTLADNNPHFVQFGLLRGAIEFDDTPVILVDHALEGDSLEDVEYDALPGMGGGTGGSTGTGGGAGSSSTGDGSDTTTGGSDEPATSSTSSGPDLPDGEDTTPGPTAGTSSTGTDTDAPAAEQDEDESGCGCSSAPGGAGPGMASLALLALFRRRGGRPSPAAAGQAP